MDEIKESEEQPDNEKQKVARINVKLPANIHKALQYARIDLDTSNEEIVSEALKTHLLKLGFLTEAGELKKPEAITISASEE